MGEDKLTRAERIRLESFAQVGMRHQIRPIPLTDHFIEAERVEKWLREAREDS